MSIEYLICECDFNYFLQIKALIILYKDIQNKIGGILRFKESSFDFFIEN